VLILPFDDARRPDVTSHPAVSASRYPRRHDEGVQGLPDARQRGRPRGRGRDRHCLRPGGDRVQQGIIGGLIGAIGGTPDFDGAGPEINDSTINVGGLTNALINFVIVAAAVYFFVVVPVNKLMERRKRGEEPETEATSEDIALLQEIRDLLRARDGQV
jgi:large conductance mechanosensitive channel